MQIKIHVVIGIVVLINDVECFCSLFGAQKLK